MTFPALRRSGAEQETTENHNLHFIACVSGSPPPTVITPRVILNPEPGYQCLWMPACAASTGLSR